MSRVLVTGGSGFIGSRALAALLEAGHEVRTTVRSLAKEPTVRELVARTGVNAGPRLEFVAADLTRDEGWADAVAGCEYVLHLASPFPPTAPSHEDELIVPAREGTLRVLRSARDAGVRRVVQTSSFAAIGYGHPRQDEPFDETTWTNLSGRAVTPYTKSKTLAERAAWDFMEREGGTMELAVVNPVAVFGPVLGPNYATSVVLVRRMMDGAMPGCPRLAFGVVDVRDVVDLHLRAMTDPSAAGERFLAIAGDAMSIREMAEALKAALGEAARRVPTRELPDFLVRLVGVFDKEVASIVPELGHLKNATSAKAREVLGWSPRPPEAALVASAETLLQMGLLETRRTST